ncbi:MAG: DUF2867 domain-containing protein [Rhizobiales bacterium]|nr:DUF2867 domain-containing protein [Hyphomicrobiales bacterium]
MTATAREIYPTSNLFEYSKTAYYTDCFAIESTNLDVPIEEIYARIFSATPKWFDALMTLCNKIVGLFGLKSTVDLSNSLTPFETAKKKFNMKTVSSPNKMMDFFVVEALIDNEIILVIKDTHLDLKISILRTDIDLVNGTSTIAVSDVIHTHNLLGKIYLFFILPMHKLIVKKMLNDAKLGGDI